MKIRGIFSELVQQDECGAPHGSSGCDPHFARACAIETHMDMSQEQFCARICRSNATHQMDPEMLTHTFCCPIDMPMDMSQEPFYARMDR